jgi:hypothetical protein
MKKLMKVTLVLSNLQLYFILCFLYFLTNELRKVVYSEKGKVVQEYFFNLLTPLFIILSLAFYILTGRTNYKKFYLFIFMTFILTIVIFECLFIK